MPIRDLALTAIVVGLLPVCFVRPYVGVLAWSWLGYMNPHRLSWGFASSLEFSQWVAIATLVGLLLTRDRRPIPWVAESVLLAAFWLFVTVTTLFAMFPERAWLDLDRFSKILLMSLVTVILCQSREKLRLVLLVVTLSLGFYGLKGGIFGVLTGGAYRVYGPQGSFIGDNNGLGLALNMILPVCFFMAREESRRPMRWLLYAVFVFSAISVLLTYSRGNFLALVVVLLLIVGKTRKAFAIPLVAAGAIGAAMFLPEEWFERIHSITDYEADRSAMGRLYAWQLAFRIALDHPLLGGGFRVFGPEVWARYMPENPIDANAHSIYFLVLAEHSFPGLALFLGLVVATLLSLRRLRHRAARLAGATWIVNYSHMIEVAILGFLAAGAFQNLTYFDLFWFLIGAAIVLKQLTADLEAGARASAAAPATNPQRTVVWSFGT